MEKKGVIRYVLRKTCFELKLSCFRPRRRARRTNSPGLTKTTGLPASTPPLLEEQGQAEMLMGQARGQAGLVPAAQSLRFQNQPEPSRFTGTALPVKFDLKKKKPTDTKSVGFRVAPASHSSPLKEQKRVVMLRRGRARGLCQHCGSIKKKNHLS